MGIKRPRGTPGAAPALGEGYEADGKRVTEFLTRTDEALHALPPKRDRDEGQLAWAAEVHTTARRVRRRFMQEHAEVLYAELTDDRRAMLRLGDLAYRAAELLPGLVPTKQQIVEERVLPQAEKEGRETDQGIFFWGLLRSPRAGRHLVDAMRRPTAAALTALPGFRATGSADLGIVSVRRDGEVAEVTVDNHRFLNAEDDLLVTALEIAVDLVLLDDDVRVGVMRGAPMRHRRYLGRRVFSAGINLTRLYQGEISLIDFFLTRELGYINKIFRGLLVEDTEADWVPPLVEKPWIGAVDTFAIGGGAQILLVFDRVICSNEAYFTLPALQEGIIPGVANLRMPRVAGNRLSRQSIYRGRRIDAASSEGGLLCDEVVDPGQVEEAVRVSAVELANPAVVSNRRMLRRGEEPDDVFREYMADYALEQCRLLASPDLVANLERTWISRNR